MCRRTAQKLWDEFRKKILEGENFVTRSSELSLYHNCDSTTIRLRYDDTTTHSTTMEVIKITICVRFDCDTTTTKIDMLIFCLHCIGSMRARYVVVGS